MIRDDFSLSLSELCMSFWPDAGIFLLGGLVPCKVVLLQYTSCRFPHCYCMKRYRLESSTVHSSNRQQWIYRIVDSGKTNCWQYIRRIVDSVFIELLTVYSSNIVKPHQNNSLGIWCQISKCSISWLFNGNQWFWRLVAFVSQTGGQLHKDTFLTKAFPHKANFHRAAAIAQWNCQRQPPWGPGFKSKAQHLRIFNLYR